MQSAHSPPPTPHGFCAPWSVEKRDQKHRKKNAVYVQGSVMEKDRQQSNRVFAQPLLGAPGSWEEAKKGVLLQASPSARLASE